jgi:hypothetical protein
MTLQTPAQTLWVFHLSNENRWTNRLKRPRKVMESSDSDNDDDVDLTDVITGQYTKVQRTKQKYKCIFKDLIN